MGWWFKSRHFSRNFFGKSNHGRLSWTISFGPFGAAGHISGAQYPVPGDRLRTPGLGGCGGPPTGLKDEPPGRLKVCGTAASHPWRSGSGEVKLARWGWFGPPGRSGDLWYSRPESLHYEAVSLPTDIALGQ